MRSLLGTLLSFGFLFFVFVILLFFVLKWFQEMVDTRKYLRLNILTIIAMSVVAIIGFVKNVYSITLMLIIPVAVSLFCIRNVVLYYRGRKL